MATEAFRYWWFERASAVALALRILLAVLAGTFVRLEAIPYEKDGLSALRFRVVTKEGEVEVESHEPDVNESHPCPPQCPGGG